MEHSAREYDVAPIPSGPSSRSMVSPMDTTAALAARYGPWKRPGARAATDAVRTMRRRPSARCISGKKVWIVATVPVTMSCIASAHASSGKSTNRP